MPKAIACPMCGNTSWVTTETGTYEREVTFFTAVKDMEDALDFGESDEIDPHFDEHWTCLMGHPADATINKFINDELELDHGFDKDDEDGV